MKTEKYNNMISAFACDFSLAKTGIEEGVDTYRLSDLDKLIKDKNTNIIKDIELLEELEFLLRTSKAEIQLK